MALTIEERINSPRGSVYDRIVREFNVDGETDFEQIEDDVRAALITAGDDSYLGLPMQNAIQIEPTERDDHWVATVTYMASAIVPLEGNLQFSFDTGGGSRTILASKETVNAYGTGATTSDNGNLINVTESSVEGVEVEYEGFDFSIRVVIAADDFTSTLVGNLIACTKHYNDATYAVTVHGAMLSFAEGELFLRRVCGGLRSDNRFDLDFQFSASPNKTGLSIGSITGIAKRGWHYLWCTYKAATVNGISAQVPQAAYVEKIYDPADFDLLPL